MSGGIYGSGVYGSSVYGGATPLGVVAVTPPLVESDAASQAFVPPPGDFAIGPDGEFVLAPTGDLALVTGAARLIQDAWMLAVTPQGAALCDPGYGDALAGLVGSRMPSPAQAQAAAAGLQSALLGLHAKRTAQGQPPGPEEGLASVAATVFAAGTALTLDLVVTTASGEQAGVALPVNGAGA